MPRNFLSIGITTSFHLSLPINLGSYEEEIKTLWIMSFAFGGWKGNNGIFDRMTLKFMNFTGKEIIIERKLANRKNFLNNLNNGSLR